MQLTSLNRKLTGHNVGPNKSHPAPGPVEANRRGRGGTILSGPSLLPGKLNLLDALLQQTALLLIDGTSVSIQLIACVVSTCLPERS